MRRERPVNLQDEARKQGENSHTNSEQARNVLECKQTFLPRIAGFGKETTSATNSKARCTDKEETRIEKTDFVR